MANRSFFATPLENQNDAPGRRDAQFKNHCLSAMLGADLFK